MACGNIFIKDFEPYLCSRFERQVRKDSMREGIPIGEKHTVFGLAAMVGISVTFFVKSPQYQDHKDLLCYVDWMSHEAGQIQSDRKCPYSRWQWQELRPDKNHTWLTEGLRSEFENLYPHGKQNCKDGKR